MCVGLFQYAAQRLTIWQVAVCGARLYPPLKKFEAGYNARIYYYPRHLLYCVLGGVNIILLSF